MPSSLHIQQRQRTDELILATIRREQNIAAGVGCTHAKLFAISMTAIALRKSVQRLLEDGRITKRRLTWQRPEFPMTRIEYFTTEGV